MKHLKNLKTNIHASAAEVDESFEDLEALAAVAGSEDSEDLDGDEDEEYTEEEEDDTEDVDEDVIDEDSEDEDGDSEFSDDSEDDEEEVTEEDASDDEEEYIEEEEEEVTEEDASDDECDEDVEYTEEDASEDEEYEEVESSEDEDEVDEDAVLASLAEQGLLVVIATTEQISEQAMGMAVAALEDEEFGDDEEVDADEEEFEEDVSDEDDIGEDDTEDEEEEVTEEDDSEDDSEEDTEDLDTEDEEEEVTEEDDSEDDSEEYSDDEADSDTEEDSEIDEDRLAPVASREMLAHASVEDVEFVLHASKSNPVWNVIVAGVPAARLALSSYGDGAEEVRSFFTTKQFVDGVKRAMASEGVLGLLDKSNAEYYANAYKSSEVFSEARAHAERIGNQKVTAATSGLREDFVDAMKIAATGMDKNFFQKPNALKRGLFIALSNVGVQQPASLIESVFAEASSDYFETLAETAEEFLDMPSEARETLRNTIENSGVIDRSREVQSNTQPAHAATASALDMIRGMAATASEENVSGSLTGSHSDRKNAIRNLF